MIYNESLKYLLKMYSEGHLLTFCMDKSIDMFTFENSSVIQEENCETCFHWRNRHRLGLEQLVRTLSLRDPKRLFKGAREQGRAEVECGGVKPPPFSKAAGNLLSLSVIIGLVGSGDF